MTQTAARSAFRLISKSRSNGLIDIFRFRSERTGLRLTIADVNGPNVSGYICLATESDSNDGLPHTLEHLIFMGSEKYPYKGILDLVANRCLASGTNAWTATDHTCYTLTTAGSDGFLLMLPIYLDHVFHPLLTNAQYTTEVHHINGQGEDAGVVYCEMQEMESQMEKLVEWKFKEMMWPAGCGYRAETGGRLENLRMSTNNDKVRQFHQAYYHPWNCEIIVIGSVNHDDVFKALEQVEEDILKKELAKRPFQRAWTSPIEPLSAPESNGSAVNEVTVQCPSDDGKTGIVSIGWRGPRVKDYYTFMAVDVMLDYLSDSAVSPLEREFIQISDPYCAGVSTCVEDHSESCIKIEFSGVKTEKLNAVRPLLGKVLNRIMSGEEDLDMRRMDDILKRAALQQQNEMETSPYNNIASSVIGDFLYGASKAETAARLDLVSLYESLRGESKDFWLDKIRTYLNLRKPHICVIGEPNKDLVAKLADAERERIQCQKDKLGSDGLDASEEILQTAIEENEKNSPPDELIEACIVNSLDGIRFFDIQTSTNRSLDEDGNANFALSRLPCTAVLHDCTGSQFIDVCVQLDTSAVKENLKPLLFLLSNLVFESPILRDGALVPYENVVSELNRDLVSYEAGTGIKGAFLRVLSLWLKVDYKRLNNIICWTRRLLYDTQFAPDRIRVIAQRLINTAAECKRDGYTVAQFLMDTLTFEPKSLPLLNNLLLQEKYLKSLLERLDHEPYAVTGDLGILREEITEPKRLVLGISCGVEIFTDANIKAEDTFAEGLLPERLKPFSDRNRAKLGGKEPSFLKPSNEFGKGIIASVGSCESCYVFQSTPISISYDDTELPALRVLLQYLDQCEGPLWREIRGKGLAYGVYVTLKLDQGLLQFSLYRTSDPVLAYEESKKVVMGHLVNAESFDEDEFDAAKRSLIFEIISKESTMKKASVQALLSYYRGVPLDYNRKLLRRIWDVQLDELPSVGEKYLKPLLDFGTSSTAVSCHPSKLEEVVSGFRNLGRDLEVVTLESENLYVF